MSGVTYYETSAPINPFMDSSIPIDMSAAEAEHGTIHKALISAGVEVLKVKPPIHCQDGVYTANWALVRGDLAVLSRLPGARTAEEEYAQTVLCELGKKVYRVPNELRFSGQGDALPCGRYLFCGSVYRSDSEAQAFVAKTLGYIRIQLQTIPLLNSRGEHVLNSSSGWPDSYFYDIDLALSVLRFPSNNQKGLIAWCPEAFMPESRKVLEQLNVVDKIAVSIEEAQNAFACNLVSTGKTVIMTRHAPIFRKELIARGFRVVMPDITELSKGGGYIRCTTLTLDNE